MHPQIMLTAVMAGASLALVSLATSLMLFRKNRDLWQTMAAVELRIDDEMIALSADLDTISGKSGEHGRRVAWLETKVRSARGEIKPVTEMVSAVTPKPTITERRHRVLSLARRGQDLQTIARTLGMPHGEVELMISLSRAA
jgi:hypothetical protein